MTGVVVMDASIVSMSSHVANVGTVMGSSMVVVVWFPVIVVVIAFDVVLWFAVTVVVIAFDVVVWFAVTVVVVAFDVVVNRFAVDVAG